MKKCIAKETVALKERVIIHPREVVELTRSAHEIIMEKSAGIGINFSGQDNEDAGTEIVEDRPSLQLDAELLVKLKVSIAYEFGALGKKRHQQ